MLHKTARLLLMGRKNTEIWNIMKSSRLKIMTSAKIQRLKEIDKKIILLNCKHTLQEICIA